MKIKKMSKTNIRSVRGFTLLEILLVVGIISILAGIVILAINPTKQLGDTRNAQRRSDVLTILNGIYQYALDNNGAFPTALAAAAATDTACDETGTNADAIDALDMEADLVDDYLTAVPSDPSADDGTVASEYYVTRTTTGRVSVCIDGQNNIENSVAISVTR